MSSQRILNTSYRAFAVGGSISWFYQEHASTSDANHHTTIEGNVSCKTLQPKTTLHKSSIGNHAISLLLEPQKTFMDAAAFNRNDDHQEQEVATKTITYDFIVIGSGSAGRSALRTLKEQCPGAQIAVIDPLRSVSGKGSNIDHYKETATGFNPKSRTVRLLSDKSTQLHYKHGILLATGCRGAPPPLELFEDSCLSRIVELRTTELLGNTKRPVLAPEFVRKAIVDSTSRGAKVAILGSGWDVSLLVETYF